MLLTWLSTSFFRLFTEGRRNKWLEGTFGRYVAPSIIEALKEDPSRLQLGGRFREISVLFSDIAGFTKFSEKLSPPDQVRLMNHYLSAHAGAVMAEGGVVDKFIGDAVMAFWGDPLDMPDHAVRACRSALAAQAIPPTLTPLCRELGLGPMSIRVGVNSGPAKVGNMGSEDRFSYTCMGDTVNLASRLEHANKEFGSKILIGPITYEQAKDVIVARPLGRLVVVGKEQPVAVYELLAMRADAPADVVALADAFSRAQEAAKAGDGTAARAALDEVERARPKDPVAAWFRGVLDDLPPGKAWSGLVVLEHK
jgi:adenylate cyclase